ncbi:MAG: MAPEG family protein [Pseudomonadota bacterium]
MLLITAVAASVLGMLHVKLSLNVIRLRQSLEVVIGDGGDETLIRAIRAQGNMAEYAPIGLILIGCMELNGLPYWVCLPIAAAFVAGRLLHPIGIKSADAPWRPRVLGMQLTLFSLLAMSVVNLVAVVARLVN